MTFSWSKIVSLNVRSYSKNPNIRNTKNKVLPVESITQFSLASSPTHCNLSYVAVSKSALWYLLSDKAHLIDVAFKVKMLRKSPFSVRALWDGLECQCSWSVFCTLASNLNTWQGCQGAWAWWEFCPDLSESRDRIWIADAIMLI